MVALLAACSDDKLEQEGKQPLPIKFALADSPQTRAGSNLYNDFPSGQDIMVAIDGKTYLYQTNGTNQITLKSNSTPFFPIDGSSVSISAININTPYFEGNLMTMSVYTNQSSDSYYIKSDKTWGQPKTDWNGLDGNGKVIPTSDPIPLTFKHVCAKIVVNVSLTGSSTSKIKEVILNDVCCSYTLNNRTGAVSSVVSPNDITIYSNSSGSSQNITCAGVIPPQSISSGANFITVKLTDCTLMYKLPKNTTFIGGNTYSYNIGTTREGNNDMLVLSASEFTYNQQQQGPTITLKDGTRTLTAGTDYEFDTSSNNTATNAGDYTVKVKFKGVYSGTASKSWKIKKASPPFTAPKYERLYPGITTATNLVTAGSTSVGTMKYTLGTSEKCDETLWSDAVPKAKDPGTYYVWYKIVSSNSNYYNTAAIGPVVARIRKVPGQVICSDGWIGEYKDRGSRTPVAVVIRWGDDTGDASNNHGIAMALKDANDGSKVKWSTENVLVNPAQMASGTYSEEYGNNYDGSSSVYNSTKYPAFKAAYSNNNTPAPPGTSGWFLPSLYQFDNALIEFGNNHNERYDKMRGYFSSRGGTDLKMDFYWTATENDASNATGFNYSSYGWYSASKQSTGYVRAWLAF